MTAPTADILSRFAVTEAAFVAETALARVWKVTRADGTAAALKVYLRDMDTEASGIALMRHLRGRGAATIYDRSDTAVLLEWLDGPSLGDLLRDGQIATADAQLLQVAKTVLAHGADAPIHLDWLSNWFAALFDAHCGPDVPATMRATLRRATALAQDLLATSGPQSPLHGDLHHDNIKESARGFLAIDAKGVRGDRHYELANAFRNPLGAEAIYRSPAIIAQRARSWAQDFDTTPNKLLSWAAAHAALSLCWTAQGHFTAAQAPEARLIDTIFALIDQSS